MESLAIVVPKKRAEQVKHKIIEKSALRTDLQIESDAKNVYIPVSQHLDIDLPFVTRDFKEHKQIVSDYRELVEVPSELRQLLPSSFDVIGHVAIVKIPDELMPHAKAIAKAISEVNKPVKTVCLDEGVKGETRTRGLKILHGGKDTLATYKEHGLVFKVDPRTMFFSPRLATERKAVADQVTVGERIFDMFAGVGPFSILIAKSRSPEKVYANDINKEAYDLLTENIKANKVDGVVVPMLGDARESAADVPSVNRIIMNLPHSSFDFLDVAAGKIAEGGTIHYYEILDQDALEGRKAEIAERMASLGKTVDSMAVRVVKSYSPTMRFFAIDIKIK